MADAQTSDWKSNWLRRSLKAGIWAATAALLGWLLKLQPTWQLLVLAVGCLLFNIVEAKGADPAGRWMERFVRLVFWGIAFALLCWMLGLPMTWPLLIFALACTLVDGILDQWLPTPPLIDLQKKS